MNPKTILVTMVRGLGELDFAEKPASYDDMKFHVQVAQDCLQQAIEDIKILIEETNN